MCVCAGVCLCLVEGGWVGGGMTWMLGYECDQGREATYMCVCVWLCLCLRV